MAGGSGAAYLGLAHHLTFPGDANAQVSKVEVPAKVMEKVEQVLGEKGCVLPAASTL